MNGVRGSQESEFPKATISTPTEAQAVATPLLRFSFWVFVEPECKPQTARLYRTWEVAPEGPGRTRAAARVGFKQENGRPCFMWRTVMMPLSCEFKFTHYRPRLSPTCPDLEATCVLFALVTQVLTQ